MSSVTQRICKIKQPWGGYIKRKDFNVVELDDRKILNLQENINPGLVGLAVDYLTRFIMGTSLKEAFKISLIGAILAKEEKKAKKLLLSIKGLDDSSIYNACKLVGYDVCYRAGMAGFKSIDKINPDKETIENISIMVQRSVLFWEQYGPIVKEGFTFEGGYTHIISTGDGDYLTRDTLWDFKVSKGELRSTHTLQLLVYYLMGIHSIHKEFLNIKNLGVYNPRKNKIYLLKIESIPQSVIDDVEYTVIGYNSKREDYKKILEENCKGGISNVTYIHKNKDHRFRTYNESNENLSIKNSNREIKVGEYVLHPVFGQGKVLSISGNERNKIAEVDFKSEGLKKILVSYLTPTEY